MQWRVQPYVGVPRAIHQTQRHATRKSARTFVCDVGMRQQVVLEAKNRPETSLTFRIETRINKGAGGPYAKHVLGTGNSPRGGLGAAMGMS